MTTQHAAPCPTCRKPVRLSETGKFRPFCSERCKLLDLSRWLDGDYVIPGPSASPEDALASADPQRTRDE